MEVPAERRRLLDAEGGDEDPSGLMSEQDAYLRSGHTHILVHDVTVSLYSSSMKEAAASVHPSNADTHLMLVVAL